MIRNYLLTILLLLAGGCVWALVNDDMDSMRFAGIVIAVVSCSVLNLMYYLPVRSSALRVLPPGILSVIIPFFFIEGSAVERSFFTFFGILNLLIGMMWLLVKRSKSSNNS